MLASIGLTPEPCGLPEYVSWYVHKDHDKVRWAYRKAQKNLEIERTEANLAAFKEARKVMLSTPHLDEMDENYKRLQYNRYADDFLISITGSKQDAENIKEQVKIFLKDKLNLTMSEEKTHVTHSRFFCAFR